MQPLRLSTGSFADAANDLLAAAVEALGVDDLCVHLVSADGERLICQASSDGLRASPLAYGLELADAPDARTALATGTPVCCADTTDAPPVPRAARARLGLRACVCAPLAAGAGVLFAGRRRPHHWTDAEVAAIERLGARLAARLDALRHRAPTLAFADEPALRSMLDAVPGIVFLVDRSFSVRHCNRPFLGDRAHARTVSLHDLLRHSDRGEELRGALADVIDGALPATELLARIDDGAEWRVDITPLPAASVDAATPAFAGAAVCCTDVTELHHARALIGEHRHLEALGQISATISHELRNVLQVVGSFLDLQESQDTDPQDRTEARTAVQRGIQLARQLLAFASLERGAGQPFDLGALLDGQRTLLAGAAGPERRFECRTTSARIAGDPDLLELAALNLVINARDATAVHGSIRVEVTTARDTRGRPVARLRVADDGCGMPPQVAARATEPFFTTKPRGHGSGLGLATVGNIARSLGGELSIHSQEGVGTAIELDFPLLTESAPVPADAAPAAAGNDPRDNAGLLVLVVEDEDLVSRWIQKLLRRAGHRPEAVTTGAAALERLRRTPPPDVVLLDLALPDIDGSDVYHATCDLALPTRWIACSGFAENAALQHLVGAGAGFLRKPFSGDELLAALQPALDDA